MTKYTSVFLQTSSVLQVLGLWLVSSIVLAFVELFSTAVSHTSRPSRSRTTFLLRFCVFLLVYSVVVVDWQLCSLRTPPQRRRTPHQRERVCSFDDRSVRRSCILFVRRSVGRCERLHRLSRLQVQCNVAQVAQSAAGDTERLRWRRLQRICLLGLQVWTQEHHLALQVVINGEFGRLSGVLCKIAKAFLRILMLDLRFM